MVGTGFSRHNFCWCVLIEFVSGIVTSSGHCQPLVGRIKHSGGILQRINRIKGIFPQTNNVKHLGIGLLALCKSDVV